MKVEFIEIDTPEYIQACQLRYQLFFAEHNLPWDIIFYEGESMSFHAAVKKEKTDEVLAYGMLTPFSNKSFSNKSFSNKPFSNKPFSNKVYQIHQIVVAPKYQRQGLGKMIMQALIAKAKTEEAQAIILEARTTTVEFYRQFGFEVISREYPSKKTGVPHLSMLRELLN